MFVKPLPIRPALAALLVATAMLLVVAASASASAYPSGAGEPATTKGTSNTWHFTTIPGAAQYQACFSIRKDGAIWKDIPGFPTGGHPASGGQCTGNPPIGG